MWIIRRCYFVCEVLTVGKHLNRWRRIDDAPEVTAKQLGGNYVQTNGSIYWFQSDIYESPPRIIEFDLNSERFRVISLPNFIIQEVICKYQTQLIEVDGRLAVLALKIHYLNPGSTYWSKNNNPSMKMCILHDSGQDTISTSIQGSRSFSNYYWTEDTFSMPPFDWKPEQLDTILPIQGTDLFLIKAKKDQFSFYYYNWKKKIFSSSKLEIEGISSFFKTSYKYSTAFAEFYAFTETLLPVN
ncbi:hypothetical protein MKW92_025943 [Papaver armeniacum]|nr:hypothetical protein MKW92_025943 [Papaver armeniacum]